MSRFTRGGLLIVSIAVAGLLIAATAPARADSPAISGTAASYGFSSYQTIGWQFSANQKISVDALGYFDFEFEHGLADSHQVGIWDSSGTLLTSATVDAGAVDPLVGFFRYKPITPYLLLAGQTYTIGGTTDAFNPPAPYDQWAFNVVGLTTDPAISLTANAARLQPTAGNTLVDPTMVGQGNVLAGPNFLIGPAPSAVPEPGSLALLFTGGLPLLGPLRRRRKSVGQGGRSVITRAIGGAQKLGPIRRRRSIRLALAPGPGHGLWL